MKRIFGLATLGMGLAVSSVFVIEAEATTIAQNSAWNVTRPGSSETIRVVAYGDSIYAGYTNPTTVARRAGPHAAAEYAAALYGQRVEVRRRAQSGAVASAIFDRIGSDESFMQDPSTRVVTFALGGNDYLQARSAFAGQTGTCNFGVLDTALANVENFTELAIQRVDERAHPNVKLKIVSNLYYPGFGSDNVTTNCTDPETGQTFNRRDRFLPLIAESNWKTCALAEQYGWVCADLFAQYMAADEDTNGDGMIDSQAIRYRSGEPMAEYIQRVTVDLVDTLTDSRMKEIESASTIDYLISDDTHPSFLGPTASTLFFIFPQTPGGNVPVFHATPGAYPDLRNPTWNRNGHDRIGQELARAYDLNLTVGPDATLLECETFESTAAFQDRVFFGPWDIWVEYGDGAGENAELTEELFALNHQYTVPGRFDVNVVVEGAYGTLWEDTATVDVLSAKEAVQQLIDQLDGLWDAGVLRRGWWNGPRQPLIMALAALENGQVDPAQSMLGDFVQTVARTPFDDATRQSFTELGLRAQAAAACNPNPRGEPPFGRPKPNPSMRQAMLPDEPELLTVEIEGRVYAEDDPILLELYGPRAED